MADATILSTVFARRPSRTSVRFFSAAVVALMGSAAVAPSPVAADDKAHAIADQFSGASAKANSGDRASPAADPLKAYEDEMLARAREEAQARAKADLAAAEEKAARERAEAAAAATRAADQAKVEAQAKAAASADDEALALSERLRAAREAHDAKLAAEREAAAAAQHAAAEAEARSAALAAAEAKKREAALAMARARIAERTRRLAEKVETARSARLASDMAAARAAEADEERLTRVAARDEGPARGAVKDDGTVTVLIVMDAGTRGIRRWNKSADPMLCVDETCYISRGAATASKRIARSKAFGPGVALGERAGDCSNKLVCAFRAVKLENGRSWMQPIDLRIMRHDRREAKLVVPDPTCTVAAGKLACTRTVTSGDYRAWIVPEPLAEQAGAKAIEAALVAELPTR